MVKYLDTVGLTHLWAKIKSYVAALITNLNLSDTYVAKESGKGLSTNDYTTAEKNKLNGIAAGAEVNVQSDWNLTSSSSDAYIKNKPTNLVQDASYVHTDNNYTSTDKNKLSGIEAGAEVNLSAYSAVKVGLVTLEAESKTDTIEFGGGGDVTVTPARPELGQSSSKKITISVTTPKKVSDLTNDSGFITINDVPEGAAASTTTPKMDGTAAVGTETAFARGDHRHPSDTSKANASEMAIEAVTGASDKKRITLKSGVSQEVLISHQDITGKADKSATVSNVAYDSTNKKITKTINGSTTDVVTVSTIKTDLNLVKGDVGLGNVENKSSATIRGEITSTNVTTALGFTPINSTEKGAANGLCPLDANSKVDAQYLPSYVDDVIEAYPRANLTELSSTWLAKDSASGTAITPESGKIYVLMADSSTYTANSQFRWSGTTYVKLADGGVTSITTDEIDSITSN